MKIDQLATRYEIALPAWIEDALRDVPDVLPEREDRMALVHALADRNFREGNGGPFAAVVADSTTGEIVSVGVNVFLSTGISSGHAEVTALGLAQARTGSWDLGADGAWERREAPDGERRSVQRELMAGHGEHAT